MPSEPHVAQRAVGLGSDWPGRPPLPERIGLFGPGSASWEVNREAVLLLGGPRALLLQLAHPLVAAGVADHSDFRRDPMSRLARTLDVTLGMTFGSRERAEALAVRLHEVHRRVSGVLTEATSAFAAGTPYRALDPELLLWVHATLIDSTFVAYRRFVGPLPLPLRRAYYQESKRLAALFGIPEAAMPRDLAAFRRYFRGMLSGPALEPTATARSLAQAVLHPGKPLWLRPFGPLTGLVAAGLLPPRMREAYGLRWGRRERRAWRLLQSGIRMTLPWTPSTLRVWRATRIAEARVGTEATASRAAGGAG